MENNNKETMTSGKIVLRLLTWMAIVLLQLIMTQVVTLVVSLFLPDMENFPQS